MWQLVGVMVWLLLYLFICLRYMSPTSIVFWVTQSIIFLTRIIIVLVWTSFHVKLSDILSIGHRKESGTHSYLTFLVKWAMALGILAESASIPVYH